MSQDTTSNEQPFIVLINEEEQYSLWPAWKAVPAGWRAVGPKGSKEECLKYVEEVWTDMRPLSLRKRMSEMAGMSPVSSSESTTA